MESEHSDRAVCQDCDSNLVLNERFSPTRKKHKHINDDIIRPYTKEDVERVSGTADYECLISSKRSLKLMDLLTEAPYIQALGCTTGMLATQLARAGLQAIYASGWMVAADANVSGETYPDQSLYPYNSMPILVDRLNRALRRASQIEWMDTKGKPTIDFQLPIVADIESGFGSSLKVFELTKSMIEAGAAAVHLEDQSPDTKKCGHLGGKVLVPTRSFIQKLVAARFASDTYGVPLIIIARTDANSADYITSDIDDYDRPFMTTERTRDGLFKIHGGLDMAIARGLAFAPYADLIWCETSSPNIAEAERFASAIHAKFPQKMLAYNCSPSFNWTKSLTPSQINNFHDKLSEFGYKFQFITLASFHATNFSFYELAKDFKERGMSAYADLQTKELALQEHGYTAVKHQHEVGTGYYDMIQSILDKNCSTLSMAGSTEEAQFK